MIPIPFGLSADLVKVLAVAALLAACYIKGCSDEKARFDEYKAMTKAVGAAQEARTRERIAQDKLRKETADAETVKLRATSTALAQRLRDERARSGILSTVPAPAGRPDRACFGRPELDAALSGFVEGVAGLIEQGESCRLALDTAKNWVEK